MIQSVAKTAAIEADFATDLTAFLNDVRLPDGCHAWVRDAGITHGQWSLSKSSTLTVNGITVVATQSGVGRWVAFGSGTAQPCFTLTTLRMLDIPSIAGHFKYPVPIGNMFFDTPGRTTLQVDKGSGFQTLVYPTDYTHMRRVGPGTPATVNDAAIGFVLAVAPAAGWTFRFTWQEWILQVDPIAQAKTMVPPNFTVRWNSNDGGANFPNAVQVPSLTDCQVEFWRETHHAGGIRGNYVNPYMRRLGRRYLPYFRGATNVFSFAIGDFVGGLSYKRQKFRVCYYDPTTGARSGLANAVIIVNGRIPDAVNGRTPVRAARSIWIQ